MKEVHIRRHAPKHSSGNLTEEGKKVAQEFNKQLEKYDLIISSPKSRAIETAQLLTGLKPIINQGIGSPFTPEQEKELHELGENHQYGIAGVILDNPQYRALIKSKAENLKKLIEETLKKLPDGGKALIISHDGIMVAAERMLKNKSLDKAEKTFKPLKGFKVYENGKIEDLD